MTSDVSQTGARSPGALTMDEGAIDARVTVAIERQRSGDLDGAEALYSEILAAAPDHPHVLQLLGVVQYQRGDYAGAIATIRRAMEILPGHADCYANLGVVYFAMGDLDNAEANFRRASELNPAGPEAFANLSQVLKKKGLPKKAIDALGRAHQIAPGAPQYLKRLGDLHLSLEEFQEAADAFVAYTALAAGDAEVQSNLGYCFEKLGRIDEAVMRYVTAAGLSDESPEIFINAGAALIRADRSEEAEIYFDKAFEQDASKWSQINNLAATLANLRQYDKAIAVFRNLVDNDPDNPAYSRDYGLALYVSGDHLGAIEQLTRATDLSPDDATVFNYLGSAYARSRNHPKAIEAFKKSIELDPAYPDPQLNLCGLLCSHLKKYDEAYIYARSALALERLPKGRTATIIKSLLSVCDFESLDTLGDVWERLQHAETFSRPAFFLDHLPLTETEDDIGKMVDTHRLWGDEVTALYASEMLKPRAILAKPVKLRIGFASPDLRGHSVAKFVKPLFDNYDKDRFEIYCYTPFEAPDDKVQKQIRATVDGFVVASNMSPREVAGKIRDDEVDILFEIAGFTRDTLLTAACYKPAPIQIEWLGYPFTTGLKQFDYMLLDPYFRPVRDEWLIEKPLLMPESWVCFGEMMDMVPIQEQLPFERNGGTITFGTMNNPYKFTREIVRLWCEVLKRVPGSRFMVVRPETKSVVFYKNIVGEFERNGVSPERLVFVDNRSNKFNHFIFYDDIDISLDTYPLTGGTTTCDALWMGVPVIALVGPAQHQRMSYSILENIGAGELCCATKEEYVERAVMLANDPQSLREYRYGLRPAMAQSPLGDAKRFTENFQNLMDDVAKRHGLR